jgi:hypothetical protein
VDVVPITNINVRNWEEFAERLKEIQEAEKSRGRSADFLYRGLGDSDWSLETTLERDGHEEMAVSAYYVVISRAKPSIESLTSMKWTLAEFPEIDASLRLPDTWNLRVFPDSETYSYMIHLRHHGFPSPLLDWTRSPYVAAFFAFRAVASAKKRNVSICVFSESPAGFHGDSLGEPQVSSMGRFVTTHRRHYLQQSEYTMCGVFREKWHFAKHEYVMARADPRQDVLWRFNIPGTERLKVLKLLDSYNLNAFSLFGSEESLMETLALRELGPRDPAP